MSHIRPATAADLMSLYRLSDADLDVNRGADGGTLPHLVFACSDGYFQRFLSDWYAQELGGNPDSLRVPGGPVELCLDYHGAERIARHAGFLHKHHQTEHAWHLWHNRCGRYWHDLPDADPMRALGDDDEAGLYLERYHQLLDMEMIEVQYGQLGITAVAELQRHYGIIRTCGPGFVPLYELVEQAAAWEIEIPSLVRDYEQRIPQIPAFA